jgi:flagellar basal body-associated protein FliL
VKLPIPKGRRAILVLGLPLGLAAAGALVFTQMSAGPKTPPVVSDPSQGQFGPMLALDDKVINLSQTTPGGYKYAKIGVTIELRPTASSFYGLHGTERTKQETTELAAYTDAVPLLIDAVGTTVASHDSSTLTTAAGRSALKAELLVSARKILGDTDVIDVFFTDLVMQ